MTYVATTSPLPACSSSSAGGSTSGRADDSGTAATDGPEQSESATFDRLPVGNDAMVPDTGMHPQDAASDTLQIDDMPVANLAVMPDAGMSDTGMSEAGNG
jgi:hypothetical protein